MKIGLLTLVFLALMGCDTSSTDPDPGLDFTIAFSELPFDFDWEKTLPTTVVGGDGTVHVQGVFGIGGCSHGPYGSLDLTLTGAVLRIESRPREGTCPSDLGVLQYDAHMVNVPPGSYLIHVEHHMDAIRSSGSFSGPVLEQQVDVQ